MPKSKEQIDDARRQGQFEGRVEQKLDDIKLKMENFNVSFGTLEARVRSNETQLTTHNEMFRDSQNTHKELFEKIKDLADISNNVVNYQTKQRGFLIAAGTLGPIVASIITASILKVLFK